MRKKILAAAVVALVVLVVAIWTRPDTFRIERSATLAAPNEAVFNLVNDFHAWPKWSPWEKADPTMVKKYEGPDAGPGARYSWAGNGEVGEGSMVIEASRVPEYIEITLEFRKPFAATNKTTFTFHAVDAGHTQVTWAMAGQNNFGAKAFSLFADMDAWIGKDFEAGLAALQTAAQASP